MYICEYISDWPSINMFFLNRRKLKKNTNELNEGINHQEQVKAGKEMKQLLNTKTYK